MSNIRKEVVKRTEMPPNDNELKVVMFQKYDFVPDLQLRPCA